MKTIFGWLIFCVLLTCDSLAKSVTSIVGNYVKLEITSDKPRDIVTKIYSGQDIKPTRIVMPPGMFNTKKFSFDGIPIGVALEMVCDEFALNMEFAIVGKDEVELKFAFRESGANVVSNHYVTISKKMEKELDEGNTSLKEWLGNRGVQFDGRMEVNFHEKGNLYEMKLTYAEWRVVTALLTLDERNYKIMRK